MRPLTGARTGSRLARLLPRRVPSVRPLTGARTGSRLAPLLARRVRGGVERTVDIRCMMRDAQPMRTTLNLDEDVLWAAKELAAQRRVPVGRVVSELARKALAPRSHRVEERNGVPLLPSRDGARPVSLAAVNALRDDEP